MKKLKIVLPAAICIATIFAFLTCEEKDNAEAPKAEQATPTEEASKPWEGGTFTDSRDGKIYKTIIIGKQTWMAENLNFKMANSCCYGNNNSNNDNSYCAEYGRLYTWDAAKEACPSGWHLPNRDEWEMLGRDGRILKARKGWSANGNGIDTYSFAALPGGSGSTKGDFPFNYVGSGGYWWESDEGSKIYYRYISSSSDDLIYYSDDKGNSYSLFSIRCVNDEAAVITTEPIDMSEIDDDQLRKVALFALDSIARVFLYSDWLDIGGLNYRLSHGWYREGQEFQSVFAEAYPQRHKYLGGWLQRFIKRIASQIPQEKYAANNVNATVRRLLIAYDDLAETPSGFRKVYEVMSKEWEVAHQAYNEIRPFARDRQLRAFVYGRGSYACEVDSWAVVWAYSFWGRRWAENPGNIEPIVAALRMLRDESFKGVEVKTETNCPESDEAAAEEARYRELEARMAEECPDKTGPLKTAEATFLEAHEDHEGRSAFSVRLANGDEIHLIGDDGNLKKGDKISITYKNRQHPFAEACWDYNLLEDIKIFAN